MAYGFLILDKSYTYDDEYRDFYLQKREELFGFAPFPPEWVVPLGNDPKFDIPKLQLESAHIGLLETYEQAEQLMPLLKERFSNRPLELVIVEKPSATELRFYSR